MTTSPKSDPIQWLRELEQAATKAQDLKVSRYDHGGGRVYTDDAQNGRHLVADFYSLPDRELWIAARNLLPVLVDVLEMTSHEHDVQDNWEACPSCATIERAVAARRSLVMSRFLVLRRPRLMPG